MVLFLRYTWNLLRFLVRSVIGLTLAKVNTKWINGILLLLLCITFFYKLPNVSGYSERFTHWENTGLVFVRVLYFLLQIKALLALKTDLYKLHFVYVNGWLGFKHTKTLEAQKLLGSEQEKVICADLTSITKHTWHLTKVTLRVSGPSLRVANVVRTGAGVAWLHLMFLEIQKDSRDRWFFDKL